MRTAVPIRMFTREGKGRQAAQCGGLLPSPVGRRGLPGSSGYEGGQEEGIQPETPQRRVWKEL